jgi:penicillin-binding protein 2
MASPKDLKNRMNVIIGIFTFTILVYIIRLYFLQVLSDNFAHTAQRNVIKPRQLEPARGILYDRNKEIIVTNTPIFDIMIIPKEMNVQDTFEFAKATHLTKEEAAKKLLSASEYSKVKPSFFKKQVEYHDYANFLEYYWKYRGFKELVRNTRNYKKAFGANYLGYIREVSKRGIELSNGYYQPGDLVGTSGLEKYYEKWLRGKKGSKMVIVDVHGREVGSFANGLYDKKPEKGLDLQITIDSDLQQLAEELMQNKVGSIVAIEPQTGEILAFVSSPTYDPNLLAGDFASQKWDSLRKNPYLPLYNRALLATYPPGSIFKILNGIIALAEGTIDLDWTYGCGGGFWRNKGKPRCHPHPAPNNIKTAIMHSCNVFFAAVYVDFLQHKKFKNIYQAYDRWHHWMKQFGVGEKTGVDLPNEKMGLLPTHNFYDKWYKKNGWRAMTIVSNSIGQGEVLMTPLQMANITACIANKGWYIQPHFLKNVIKPKNFVDTLEYPVFQKITIDFSQSVIPKDSIFEAIFDGMELVVEQGTGFLARVPGIRICGKTGTAQNKQGDDHSVFICFAPRENPQIALAVIVENAGFGGVVAAPIASFLIEKYLTKEIKDPKKLQEWKEKSFLPPLYTSPKDSSNKTLPDTSKKNL